MNSINIESRRFSDDGYLNQQAFYDCESVRMPDKLASLSLSESQSALAEGCSAGGDATNGAENFISAEESEFLDTFKKFGEQRQEFLIKIITSEMSYYQQSRIAAHLTPLLQRDFISTLCARGLNCIAESILCYLDAKDLCRAELVNRQWQQTIANGQLWKKFIECKVCNDTLWKGLSEKRQWCKYLFKHRPSPSNIPHVFYRQLYPRIVSDVKNLEHNWRTGSHILRRIECQSENNKGVYCLQYDDNKIISGLRDDTIKIWDKRTSACLKTITGHTGSVLCVQYDERVIISGSSDASIRVWDVETGELLNVLVHHCEPVLHLRFQNGIMVSCSKDRNIAVWDMVSPTEINVRRVLVGHRAAVNVVDFDEKYIVSASGDRTIKVWCATTCEFVRTLSGHTRGIACLQYKDGIIVSGSSDNTIRIWNIETGICLRVLTGHDELVRCLRFDNKFIVSGAYDGKVKIWDLKAILDPAVPTGTSLCIRTLNEHTGRVFRLQFDEFQIVTSSHDDTILIWDFLNYTTNINDVKPYVEPNL